MKHGIFDMDGLLTDTERIYQRFWKEEILRRGITPDPGFGLQVCGTNPQGCAEVIRRFYPQIDAVDYRDTVYALAEQAAFVHVDLKPGVKELLAYLHGSGKKIAVASSSSLAAIRHHLEYTGIIQYFDALVSGHEVVNGKPAPDIFLLAAQRLGVDPKDCYVFEDGANGGWAGLAAGCTTVMVPDYVPVPEALAARVAAVKPSLLDALSDIQKGIL